MSLRDPIAGRKLPCCRERRRFLRSLSIPTFSLSGVRGDSRIFESRPSTRPCYVIGLQGPFETNPWNAPRRNNYSILDWGVAASIRDTSLDMGNCVAKWFIESACARWFPHISVRTLFEENKVFSLVQPRNNRRARGLEQSEHDVTDSKRRASNRLVKRLEIAVNRRRRKLAS